MNIFLLKDYRIGEKVTRSTRDYVLVMTWNIHPGGRCTSITIHCLRNLGSIFEEDVSLACIHYTKQWQHIKRASVVAVKPYSLLHIFINKVDRSPAKYSTVWGSILSIISSLKIWFQWFSKIVDVKKDYQQYEVNYTVKNSVLCYTEDKTMGHNGPLSFESTDV